MAPLSFQVFDMCTKYISVIHFLFLNININLEPLLLWRYSIGFYETDCINGRSVFYIYLSNVVSRLWVIELVSSRLKVWIILKICIQLQITIFDIITAVPRCAHTSPPTFFFLCRYVWSQQDLVSSRNELLLLHNLQLIPWCLLTLHHEPSVSYVVSVSGVGSSD